MEVEENFEGAVEDEVGEEMKEEEEEEEDSSSRA